MPCSSFYTYFIGNRETARLKIGEVSKSHIKKTFKKEVDNGTKGRKVIMGGNI